MKDVAAIAKKIGSLPLFAGIGQDCLCDWLAVCPPEEITAAIGESLGKQRHLCVLLEGHAAVFSADSGRNVILREIKAPAVFGAASLFCPGEAPLSRIEARTPCRALLFAPDAITALMDRDSSFRNAYLTFLAGRVQFLNRKILCFTAGSAERRLALWLTLEENNTVTLPASLTALADMLNLGRASLYRALDKLEGDGLIRREGRVITLISQDELLRKYQ
ncbi:MAG: Crp/Fnr family transcriptional regulator [Clostridia bacterium]|nr:Crp/Fnr family transcriptional regulator [Clostridia bacterium]